jgi:hypothetical protein
MVDKPTDPPDLKRVETVEKAHGRIETRRLALRTELPSRLDEKWHGLTAICRIERDRELKDKGTRDLVYAITDLPHRHLEPALLLQLSRDHWLIENGLFHVRDVTFHEDASRLRTGSAPQVLALLRNTVIALVHATGQRPRPAREAFAENKWRAIRLIMGG